MPSFNFFPWSGFGDTEVQGSSFFPTWLPHFFDVVIIIKAFFMSSRSYGETFLSIGLVVSEKTEKISMDGRMY